jgi:hypothetical protein
MRAVGFFASGLRVGGAVIGVSPTSAMVGVSARAAGRIGAPHGRLRYRDDGLVARLRRIVGGQITRAIGQKGARFSANQKDLIRKSAVVGRHNRYTEISKAIAQSQLRRKPIHIDSAMRQ